MEGLHESISQKLYWLSRLRRRAKFLREKIAVKYNPWEERELDALNYAIKECRQVIKQECQMFKHFALRFEKILPGADSNGAVNPASPDLSL